MFLLYFLPIPYLPAAHLQNCLLFFRLEREEYYRHRILARKYPDQFLSIIIDGMKLRYQASFTCIIDLSTFSYGSKQD